MGLCSVRVRPPPPAPVLLMKIGITSTVPIEIPISTGNCPLDLNNLFISSPNPKFLIQLAESEGLPQNICSWIKGIYAITLHDEVDHVIAVTGGDCSNTIALAEILQRKGKRITPFEYPISGEIQRLKEEFERLIITFHTTWEDVYLTYRSLNEIRSKLMELDRLTYEGNVVSGYENHLFLVSSSDFEGNPKAYEAKVMAFISEVKKRPPFKEEIRLGYVGVPPIFGDIYSVLEDLGARVVFNEVQRQFSLPSFEMPILKAYLSYTYPYGIARRIRDIREQIRLRQIDGIIHYVQNFCYRQLYDILLREELPVAVLTLEGNEPGPLDKRSLVRIEGFLEMLRAQKRAWI